MRTLLSITLFAVLTVFGASTAFACSCHFHSHRSDFRHAKAVFIGTVLHLGRSGGNDRDFLKYLPYAVTLQVDRSWKGPATARILVHTDNGTSGCGGVQFEVGKQYLVYAYDYDSRLDATTGCSRIRRFDDLDENDERSVRQLNSRWFRVWSRIWPL